MISRNKNSKLDFLPKLWPAVVLCLGLALAACGGSDQLTISGGTVLKGSVQSNGIGLKGYEVSLYAALPNQDPAQDSSWQLLGTAKTNDSGNFELSYPLPKNGPLLFVEAEKGSAMLASSINTGGSDIPQQAIINARTTVATANAFAQFVDGTKIQGNAVGMINAAHMVDNLVDPQTGTVGTVLSTTPNGTETSTWATFNSLANVVAACVADSSDCTQLFKATTPAGGAAPGNVLQAMANLVKNPAYPGYPANDDDPIFQLSQVNPVYQPALTARPTNWLLFLKFTGGNYSAQNSDNLMNGPGNPAIDAKGYVWVNDNYKPEAPGDTACAGTRLLEFTPWGEPVSGTPYRGGGLDGQGWGATFDPHGNYWTSNFGFEDPPCEDTPQAAKHNSVTEFAPDGTPISPDTGYTQGNISWPMGTVSDRDGNIWIASCGNDTITEYPGGDPSKAINIALPAPSTTSPYPQVKPFGVVVDLDGDIWITDNRNDTVSILSPDGKLIDTLRNPPNASPSERLISHPIGNAVDSQGNVWIANSDWLDAPCPDRTHLGTAQNPSITLYQMESKKPWPGSPFTGGGLTMPWGIAVDGDDTVWVFNFGVTPPQPVQSPIPVGISRFCGTDTSKCPAGLTTGDPISPSTGYRSNALDRLTGGQIDPSGNIWVMNNWKIQVNPDVNPGENSIVVVIGAAGPIKTPLIGPPVPFK